MPDNPPTDAADPPRRGPRSRALRRFFRSWLVWAGAAILVLLTAASVWGWFHGNAKIGETPRYDYQQLEQKYQPPGADHLFGTDELGRDLLVRTFYGGSISLAIGLMAATVSVIIGVSWGATAGYLGGKTDAVMMRIVDVLYGLPYILLVILLTVAFGQSIVVLFLAIGAVSWLTMARVVRGQVLSLKNNDYIAAAVAAGARHRRIIAVHLLPNLLGPIIVYATLIIPQAILQESFLSFLGIGVEAPKASWGSLASQGIRDLNPIGSPWWMTLFPCLMLALTLLSLNLIGDGLRDAFDPQLKKRK